MNIDIEWSPNNLIKLDTLKLSKKYLVPGRFSRFTEQEIKKDRERAWLNAKLHERVIDRMRKIRIKATSEIISTYKTVGILPISQTLDYPPWPLFLAITKKWRNLTRFDTEQKKIAMLNDIQSPDAQQIGKKNADLFEEVVIKYFRSLGVKLKDEDDLKKEQIAKYGRPIWTVDLWFADNPIHINGHKVHWIECKNYMFTDVKLFQRSVTKQVTKYHEQWGPGAVVFSHGSVIPLNVDGVLLLDGLPFVKGDLKKRIKIKI